MAGPAPMPTDPRTEAEWRELLRQRITESGLSLHAFARQVLIREERTCRRWLSGESPIPKAVLDWLAKPERAAWP